MRNTTISILVFLCWVTIGFAQDDKSKPNIVVIFTDDQTYRAIGYNNPEVLTPHLDSLANKGLIFNKTFTTTPVCAASRASILTGLYPQTNGTVALNSDTFIENIVEKKRYHTVADLLKQAGYTTYFSGKSHLGNPKDYGFEFGYESTSFDDKIAFDEVSKFVEKDVFGKQPFFIWLAPRQPHVPLKPKKQWLAFYPLQNISIEKNFLIQPKLKSVFNQGLPGENYYRDSEYINNYKKLPAGPPRSEKIIKEFTKAYYATISHLDEQIGCMIDELKDKGHMENTIIIFLSDNGYFLGNHGLGNKLTMHEESVRIPMFIYWDKLKLKVHESDALVSTTDILPTLLELAGIPFPEYLHGKSLLPILKDPSFSINDFVASESVGVGGKIGTGHRMIRTAEWKYILTDINDELLFNLTEDPFELNNLITIDNYEPILGKLKGFYKNWRDLVGDEKPYP